MKKALVLCMFLTGFGLAGPQAQDVDVQDGTYIGIGVIFTAIGGDFDGQRFFYDSSEAIVVPKIDAGAGFDVVLGYKSGYWGFELFFNYAGSDAKFGARDIKVHRLQYGLGGRLYPLPEAQLQPFVSVGFGAEYLLAENASVDASSNLGDATYTGVDFRIGGGLAYYLTPRLALNCKFEYVYAIFSDAEGIKGEKKPLDPSLKASSLLAGLSLTYAF